MTSQTVSKQDQFLAYVETIQKKRMDGQSITEADIREAAVDFVDVDKFQDFVEGELAFQRGDYKASIEHFLAAQGVPHYHYFCYRSSAFVSNALGRQKKAQVFLRKALKVFATDDQCLELLAEILDESNETEEARALKRQVQDIRSGKRPSFNRDTTDDELSCQGPVGLAEQEMNELTHLFQEESEERVPMYDTRETTAETKTPKTSTTEVDSTGTYFGGAKTETDLGTASHAIDALKELAGSPYEVETDSTERFITDHLGTGNSLEQRINTYRRGQVEAMSEYAKTAADRIQQDEQFLLVLNGWNYEAKEERVLTESLLPSSYRHTTGGYYIRWNNKGIVINPGPHFLKNFHERGMHVKDIDAVIVTQDRVEAYQDIHAIYDLAYHLNKMDSRLHIINYYLNQQTHRRIASSLKPHFKQERNSVHSLDLYVDSPDVESLELTDGVTLHYFPTTTNTEKSSTVGLRLELTRTSLAGTNMAQESKVTIGYLSGAGYSSLLSQHLTNTDIVIAGFENTDTDDYNKLKYNPASLGYFGTSTLIQETAPKLLITSEFSGREGDIRVEAAKKLRQEWAYTSTHSTMIVPGDTGLHLDLEQQRIRCSVTGTLVDPAQVQVVKTEDAFGALRFLSPSCLV